MIEQTGQGVESVMEQGTSASAAQAAALRESLGRATDNVAEALETTRAIGALARQLRVLASNTSIEAARVPQAEALTEIAHRMKVLAEQASDLNTALVNTLQVQAHALGELSGALSADDMTPDAGVSMPLPAERTGS